MEQEASSPVISLQARHCLYKKFFSPFTSIRQNEERVIPSSWKCRKIYSLL